MTKMGRNPFEEEREQLDPSPPTPPETQTLEKPKSDPPTIETQEELPTMKEWVLNDLPKELQSFKGRLKALAKDLVKLEKE